MSNYGYVLETGEVKLAGRSAELAADPRVIEAYLGLGQASTELPKGPTRAPPELASGIVES